MGAEMRPAAQGIAPSPRKERGLPRGSVRQASQSLTVAGQEAYGHGLHRPVTGTVTPRGTRANRPSGPSSRPARLTVEKRAPTRESRRASLRAPVAAYHPRSPVTYEKQVLLFNALPLLLLAALYLAAAATLGPVLWRERRNVDELEVATALFFLTFGMGAAILGVALVVEQRPLGGHLWGAIVLVALALVPPLPLLRRWGDRALLLTRGARLREIEARSSERDRGLQSVAEASSRLAHARDELDVAQVLAEALESLLRVEVSSVSLVTEDGREVHGLYARGGDGDLAWWPDVRLDVQNEVSGIAAAARDAAPLVVYDAHASRVVSRRLVEATGVQSVAFVPMISERRVLGVLAFGSRFEKRAFADEELALTHALAAEGALALERLRSASKLGEALERERLLARIARRVRSELDVVALMDAAVAETGKALGAERCAIVRERGAVAALWTAPGAPADDADVLSALESVLGRRRTLVTTAGGVDLAAVPIGVFDSVLGVLGVRRLHGEGWVDEELALVEAVARELAVALHTARLLEENERRLREQRGFFRVATALGQPLSFERTVEALGEAATDALGGSFSAVLLPESGRLRLTGPQEVPKRLGKVLAGGLDAGGAAVLTAAAAERRLLTSARAERDERFGSAWRSAAKGVYTSLLAVPVDDPRSGEAGLVLVFFAEERAFADEELDLALHLAEAARGALQRSQLFEAERSSRSLAQQLARTGSVLATELDPAAVLDEVVRQAPMLVRADACAIHVLEDDELVVAAAEGEVPADAIGTRSPATAGLCGEVVQSRAPRQLEDAAADDRARSADPLLAAGHASYLGVPLFGSEGALRGVLALYTAHARTWRDEEIEALLALAGNASAALANAELYQRVAVEKERNDAILANVADGIVAVDREGAVVLWNAAAERVTGIAAADAIGREPEDLLQRRLASEEGARIGDRIVSIRRGSRELWLSLTEAVMRDPAGEIAGRIFAFRDISADLLVEQMKSDFVSTISHELRTPLTSIYGFAETLLRRDELFTSVERSTFIGYIASESERLTKIVDALLNVARLDTGDLQVQLAPTELEPVLSEAVRSQEELAGFNGHRFVLDLPSARLAAQADREKLRQILANLLDNAVKYSPAGGTVTVAARRRSEVVELRVSDEGVGVPEGEQERIFRKFYRGPGGNGGGTGLGLFIARGLVAAMGGRIWVESAEGHGSSFIFELPLAGVEE